MGFDYKKFLPHAGAIVLFIIIALAYFHPVLKGKAIFQSDIVQYTGMAKQQNDFRSETGEETYWTNSAFGGMPTYQLGAKYPYNYIKKLDLTIRFLPRPADYLFLYFIGLYILLLVLKLDYKFAFLGALAFGFSTYLIIILGVGHNAKAHAIAYMPLVLSGIFLTFRGKYGWGFLLTTVGMALELVANHIQMTYYLGILVVCIGIAYLIDAYKKNVLPHYFKSVGLMILAVILALGLNATNLLATQEYAAASTRGKSEITINPDGTPKRSGDSGLSYDYITEYSYGKLESFNLFIPRFMGGGNGEPLPEDGKALDYILKNAESQQEAEEMFRAASMYWGDQPIVAAPAYIGAVVMFLAVLALFLIRGRFKWWAVSGIVVTLLLSWGDNLSFLTKFFIDYVPLYDKFRAVSSIQVIIELILPIIAMVGLFQFFNDVNTKEKKQKALYYATGITGGLALLFLIAKGVFLDFSSIYDGFVIDRHGLPFMNAIREDRMGLLTADTLRSLIFVILTGTVLWLLLQKKLKELWAIIALAILLLVDLVGVDRKYVNEDDFVSARLIERPYQATSADEAILNDPNHFRVYDVTADAFKSGRASFFHNALGGYHAAKLRRIQDIYDFYISPGNIEILSMLNVKYILVPGPEGAEAQQNPYVNGPAWFVENVLSANNANEELLLLDSLDTKNTAVIPVEILSKIPTKDIVRDSTATIDILKFEPNYLEYQTSSNTQQLAVFSEIYYPKGWKVFINDQPAEFFRANYVLRAMVIPPGVNTIRFQFEPEIIEKGSTVSLISFVLLIVVLLALLFIQFRKKKTASE